MKKVEAYVRLQLGAGQANPAPPVASALGPKGINLPGFCSAFNAQTQHLKKGQRVTVVVTVYSDKSFTFILKKPIATELLKEVAGIQAGSSNPLAQKVGKVTRAQIEQIAKIKQSDLTAGDLEAAIRTLAGSARSMGLEVEGG